MKEIILTDNFKKSFKKRLTNIQQEKFFKKLELFNQNHFHPSLRFHKLNGTLEDQCSISIEENLRVILIEDYNSIILIDIGTHDQVYR